MDSEDRARIDSNLDRVRSNEENLKRRLESEVGVATTLYDMVANASKDIDEKLGKNNEALQIARKEWKEGIRDMNHHRQMIRMEQELVKLNLWIVQLMNGINRKQRIALTALVKKKIPLSDLIIIVRPVEFMKEMKRLEHSLPLNLGFPRKSNDEINFRIMGLIKQRAVAINRGIIEIHFHVPIVDYGKYRTIKGVVSPQLKGIC
ncbi:hypothetical protein ZHAS_00000208 [Anopheles sinensis]|uniref:Uncharacterized protein n=1 Tax=Anopheles sinensis TaxID=74873 RepID=A0A084V9Z9_ANOSI|nr:hypothetical protein ZHAS_00000208 [Anopheles sinensis]